MIENGSGTYSLSKDGSRLIFRTTRFVASKGSVLHSGIYNREFSSVLASFALAGTVYFLLVMSFGKGPGLYALFMLLFIGTFPLFRAYVFRGRSLETVLDRSKGYVEIGRCRLRRKVLLNRPLEDISRVRIDATKAEVVNRDGVEFVEKISAQHGTVIPGFGEETTFYSLMLRFADGTEYTVFADSSMQDVLAVHDEMKEFLKI